MIMRRPTVRVRLTLWYGAMFFLGGALLVTVTYLLAVHNVRNHPVSATLSAPASGATRQMGQVAIQGNTVPLDAVPAAVSAAQNNATDAAMSTLLIQSLIALGVIGAAAVGIGWLLAGRSLRPLHRVTATAHRVADRSLHERIALDGPADEIKELADTFDAMLERLDRSFDGQRRFVANASHELRTPLTINRALIEYAMTDDDATPAMRQLGTRLLEVNGRHERLIDGLLALARGEQDIAEPTRVDVGQLAQRVVDQAGIDKSTVDIQARLRPAFAFGDAMLLERLVANLVGNAVRYNVPDGWVSVEVRTTPSKITLSIVNSGPIVPTAEIPRLFEPFRRAHADRIDSRQGAGLGLSIVRSIATAHRGQVRAMARTGGGLIVQLILPTAAAHQLAPM